MDQNVCNQLPVDGHVACFLVFLSAHIAEEVLALYVSRTHVRKFYQGRLGNVEL